MSRRAVFVEMKEKEPIEQFDISEFLFVYKQSILLELKEQGGLDEMQLQYCIEKLLAEKNQSNKIVSRH